MELREARGRGPALGVGGWGRGSLRLISKERATAHTPLTAGRGARRAEDKTTIWVEGDL